MNAWGMLTIAVAVAVAVTITSVEAQSVPSCAQKLIPCVDYINSTTTPPSSCCNPIKETVETQLACLCNLYATPGLLESFNINVTQAVALSRRCGVTSDLSNCKGSAPSPSSTTSTTPATTGSDNGAGRVAFTGLSFLLLFWASLLFN
ncbi:non-specific lipid transfer protein GPI-anchored 7-like [Prosopis cineraria]|uniref:non-specific lipid transfer protein GPI-anchored 7-like n=1 Tax=Prosopis cineraria TaxID=364024 RepID=UPI00240F0AFA|nr:non-specific lipid transfer protein GPI-anchored 7-like [Prosopis cineraria]XP_054809852.1 non-specific lipid transfer protein GPI-anchored 7-like [Prosopis cineraria]